MDLNDKIKSAAEILYQRKNAHVLTGAGISVDSGIPDFRSKGGIWDRFDPAEYAHINNFKKDPEKLWYFFRTMENEFGEAKPNPGHIALGELEKIGIVKSIATQNIDDLHSRGGAKRVLYLHGNNEKLVCIKCLNKYERDEELLIEKDVPHCACGYVLKPDVVMFGEMLPQDILLKAQKYAANAKVFIVAGTSAQVMPASMLPVIAKDYGAFIIEINLEQTGLTQSITDIFLQGSTSKILPALVEEIKKLG